MLWEGLGVLRSAGHIDISISVECASFEVLAAVWHMMCVTA
jgi:hypothetical protein